MQNIISYLEYHISEFTESEQIIANYFIHNTDSNKVKIVDVAEKLYISTATISRFVKKIGYDNYKSFIHEYTQSLKINAQETEAINQEAYDMWQIHNKFYSKLYNNFATIDLNYIANRLSNSKIIYTFGFGKTEDTMNMMIYRLEVLTQNIKSVPHYEHLLYTIENVMDHQSLIIVFYHSSYFLDELKTVIKLANQNFIPVIVISLNIELENKHNAYVVNLYPFEDDTVVQYATTMYAPFLLFIDAIYMTLYRKKAEDKSIYQMF